MGDEVQKWVDQALLAINQGDLARAEAVLRQAKKQFPRAAEVFHLLGVVQLQSGSAAEAVVFFRKAVKLSPNTAVYHFHLGNALVQKGQADKALPCYRRVIQVDPGFAQAYTNLAILLSQQDKHAEAATLLARVLKLDPDDRQAHLNYAAVATKLGDTAAALESLDYLAANGPDESDGFWKEIGIRYAILKAADKAEQALCRALELRPNDMECWKELAAVLELQKDLGGAHQAIHEVLERSGYGLEELKWAIGRLKRCGFSREVVEIGLKAQAMAPEDCALKDGVLLEMNYLEDVSSEALFEAHQRLGCCLPSPEPVAYHNPCTSGRRLRIGYMSADFRQHSVAYFLAPVLQCHDKARVEVFCYYNKDLSDEVTSELQGYADHWRVIVELDDAAVVRQVRKDEIDILVDLSGHTKGARPQVLARRAAPIQVTWLGYPNTTGIPAVDYRLTDDLCDPPGMTEMLHTERLVRLPGVFSCYRPPVEAPLVAPPPCECCGSVTFGSFNSYLKLTDGMLNLWADILLNVAGARLVLKGKYYQYAYVKERIWTAFEHRGVARERIELVSHVDDLAAHLARYSEIDVALDTYPYCGTTTTLEALWMGVPVITLEGEDHRSRVGTSQLSALGLQNLIATTPGEYVEKAVALADGAPYLAELRMGMRDRLLKSPLLDHVGFTRTLEDAFGSLWDEWCQSRPRPAADSEVACGQTQ